MPDFSLEDATGVGRVCGVDEVGRGPWAGPVIACAVVIDRHASLLDMLSDLDYSKKLSSKKRDTLYSALVEKVEFSLGEASVAEIDALNILQASLLAMRRAVTGLSKQPQTAIVDGNRDPGLDVPTTLAVKGDSRSFSIAAASVIAKVTRDRLMKNLASDFPGYGWESNAGYGVAAHQKGLKILGVTPHHRKSFAPIRKLLGDP